MADRKLIEAAARALRAQWPHEDYDTDPAIRREYRRAAKAIIDVVLTRLDDGEDFHVVEFRPGHWIIRHPMSCRPALFECPVNLAGQEAFLEPPDGLGRFRLDLTDGRLVVGEQVQA